MATADHPGPIEDATLASIARGDLDAAFQAHLARFVEIVNDPGAFTQDKDGTIVCRIDVTLEFHHHVPTGQSSIGASTKFKDPKRVPSFRSAFVQHGAVMVQPFQQAGLFEIRGGEVRGQDAD